MILLPVVALVKKEVEMLSLNVLNADDGIFAREECLLFLYGMTSAEIQVCWGILSHLSGTLSSAVLLSAKIGSKVEKAKKEKIITLLRNIF